jgi:hypothetical protein
MDIDQNMHGIGKIETKSVGKKTILILQECIRCCEGYLERELWVS